MFDDGLILIYIFNSWCSSSCNEHCWSRLFTNTVCGAQGRDFTLREAETKETISRRCSAIWDGRYGSSLLMIPPPPPQRHTIYLHHHHNKKTTNIYRSTPSYYSRISFEFIKTPARIIDYQTALFEAIMTNNGTNALAYANIIWPVLPRILNQNHSPIPIGFLPKGALRDQQNQLNIKSCIIICDVLEDIKKMIT